MPGIHWNDQTPNWRFFPICQGSAFRRCGTWYHLLDRSILLSLYSRKLKVVPNRKRDAPKGNGVDRPNLKGTMLQWVAREGSMTNAKEM